MLCGHEHEISRISEFSQTTCASVPIGEVNTKPPSGFTVIVPFKLVLSQVPPRVVTVKGYTCMVVIPADGVPNIVTKSLIIEKLIPAGRPVTFALVAPPLNS